MLGRSALMTSSRINYGNWLGNYSDVSLLLRNGTPGLVPSDESPTPKAITAVGNASVTTAVAKWNQGSGGSSLSFDGSGDYFSVSKNTDFEFGNGDFTVECWVRLNSIATDQTFTSYGAGASGSIFGWAIERLAASGFRFFLYSGSILYARSNTAAASVNTWYHLAVVRSSGSLILYVDGVASASTSANVTINAPTGALLAIGSFWKTLRFTNGYIDDLRITKGVARYVSNFTPPPAELPAF